MIDISAIITGHREGLLAGPSIASFDAAIANARDSGLNVEPIVVLDRCDDLTRSIFEDGPDRGYLILQGDGGDPALARNQGVAAASGRFVSFLDADDLWSSNWLTRSYAFCVEASRPTIGHSECNIVFGKVSHVWFHLDSEAPGFDLDTLRVENYWDALCFADRRILLDSPYVQNDVAAGYGHEDWHWNCVTLARGISHRPVPGTVHAKRRRDGSQSTRCTQNDVVIWPNAITKYAFRMPGDRLEPAVLPHTRPAPAVTPRRQL